ncbi:Na+/H+ antiporter NhaA [Xylanimonas cellulosilytica DSM 15894]|uniref:Na(+)/H(+) antiporter NhaA n=1 Tax=Xylanimonas cellulosilytica (strain DSM 15894 / JCM 12276 / CECT 5975 / KCTC 9989 / LMG 20990 / NBRC 107835 / XIL07) TaxID=446471 RepID=D1BYB3_XYLCX|nr:Na+/H+ antiporter NhaA [Xylanimonas cellulosilytica]ACZ29956.1 Na+/H+ antiporter NhaA [Xylanimonas cellulosilytica DSM 15894]
MTNASPAARLRAWAARDLSGGILLLGAALLGLLLANSPWRHGYESVAATVVGPHALHLDLTLAQWAADGLLAVFFLAVGLELKHELVAGSLRNPREAGVPVLAAVGGMVVPAIAFVVVEVALDDRGGLGGWAIPTATDIAFALAVLAVFGKGLPTAIRTFLLTLAVVDDLLAIIVIALFYGDGLHAWPLAGALAAIVVAGLHLRSRRPRWWLLAPLALAAWALLHSSGVHATIAGVLLGLTVPARPIHGETLDRAQRWAHAVTPWSQGVALPLFALFAAGVNLVDGGGAGAILGQPVVLAVVVGLMAGKLVGVLGTAALVTRLTPLRLAQGIGVRDLLPVGLLAGIGFTVALLVSELSYGPTSSLTEGAKVAILLASAGAAVLGAVCLRWDARQARSDDMNRDGIADGVVERIGDAEASPVVEPVETTGPRGPSGG